MSKYDIRIIHSDRKSVSIKITRELTVIVRAPLHMKDGDVMSVVEKNSAWIDRHIKKIQQEIESAAQNGNIVKFTDEDIRRFADEASVIIAERVAHFAPIVGVSYGRITIRNQKTRWGSCSSAGNLNFNCLLMLTPPEILDYVVVHELCHRREMNHSKKFWSEVERVLPNYKTCRKWLKDNEGTILCRL